MALPRYLSKEHCQFLADMRRVDRKVFHHEGNAFWKGPAILIQSLTELHDICFDTSVRVKYEISARGYVVHPDAYGEIK